MQNDKTVKTNEKKKEFLIVPTLKTHDLYH
jgi:hypothetical protein